MSHIDDFIWVGRDLFTGGMNSSHGGNLSVCDGDRILITRRGSMLGRLTVSDIVEAPLVDDGLERPEASRELVVHRAIYLATDATAIVHSHPPYTIAASLDGSEITPIDSEAAYLLGSVPVLSPATLIASPEAAEMLAETLATVPVAVLRSHGPFAKGSSLEAAYMWISVLEAACQVLHLHRRDATSPL